MGKEGNMQRGKWGNGKSEKREKEKMGKGKKEKKGENGKREKWEKGEMGRRGKGEKVNMGKREYVTFAPVSNIYILFRVFSRPHQFLFDFTPLES